MEKKEKQYISANFDDPNLSPEKFKFFYFTHDKMHLIFNRQFYKPVAK